MSDETGLIYLDNAATTPLAASVRDAMRPWLEEGFANPSSVHRAGARAREAIEDARRRIAARLGLAAETIVFTSGGSEANNMAVRGLVLARPTGRRHVVATAVEHPSVREAIRSLEPLGAEITWVRPGSGGRVTAAEIIAAVRPETALVAVIHGQNEYGVVQPVEAVAAGLARLDRPVPLHIDAVQSFGKIPLPAPSVEIATCALSAHKIHGPKGAGALVVRTRRPLWPLIAGGGQEGGRRSGTENVAAIVGFARAVDDLPEVSEVSRRLLPLRDRLVREVRERIPDTTVLGVDAPRLPHVVALLVDGVPGEVLVHHLDAEGIAISRGSACQASKKETSPTWAALGIPARKAHGIIRISLSTRSTSREIDRVVRALERHVAAIRRLNRTGRGDR